VKAEPSLRFPPLSLPVFSGGRRDEGWKTMGIMRHYNEYTEKPRTNDVVST